MKILLTCVCFTLILSVSFGQDTQFGWAKAFGGSGYIYNEDMDFDAEGNIYISGYIQGTVDADPGTPVVNLVSAGGYDLFVIKLNKNGEYIWSKRLGATGNESGTGINITNTGEIAITGYFESTVDFDPTSSQGALTSAGKTDVFVLKLDKDGKYVWVVSIGNASLQEGVDVTSDKSGNIIAVGNVSGVVDFDPGAAKFELSGGSVWDAYILKLNPSGNFLWAKRFGSGDNDVARDVVLDNADNIILSGGFSGTVDFDPGNGVVSKYGQGNADGHVLKLSKDGMYQWVHTMTSPGFDAYAGLDIDKNNNIAIVCLFTDNINMNPIGIASNFTAKGAEDVAVMKLSANGTFQWAKQIGGTDIDWCHDVAFDDNGNVFATGFFYNQCFFGDNTLMLQSKGIEDGYFTKFSPTGSVLWTKQIGGTSSDGLNLLKMYNNEIYLGGNAYGKVDLNPEAGEQFYTPNGTDSYIIKLSQGPSATVDPIVHQISIFPNPATDFITVKFETESELKLIFDMHGNLILKTIETNIDIQSLKSGMYVLKTLDGGISKFIKI